MVEGRETYFTPYAFHEKTPKFAQSLDFFRSQVAIYTAFHEESKSEVETNQILEPEGKICFENQVSRSDFLS